MIQCIRKNAQDSEAKITLQVQSSIWWRECQLSREGKEPDQAATLLSFHASHPTLWAEQEDPLVPTGAGWQLPPRPPSGHSWVENASKAEAERAFLESEKWTVTSELITSINFPEFKYLLKKCGSPPWCLISGSFNPCSENTLMLNRSLSVYFLISSFLWKRGQIITIPCDSIP